MPGVVYHPLGVVCFHQSYQKYLIFFSERGVDSASFSSEITPTNSEILHRNNP